MKAVFGLVLVVSSVLLRGSTRGGSPDEMIVKWT